MICIVMTAEDVPRIQRTVHRDVYKRQAFNSDPQVVAYGTLQAHTITLFYFLLAFSHCIAGIMRGAGKA